MKLNNISEICVPPETQFQNRSKLMYTWILFSQSKNSLIHEKSNFCDSPLSEVYILRITRKGTTLIKAVLCSAYLVPEIRVLFALVHTCKLFSPAMAQLKWVFWGKRNSLIQLFRIQFITLFSCFAYIRNKASIPGDNLIWAFTIKYQKCRKSFLHKWVTLII